MTAFRKGVRLGLDLGLARIGVARSDTDGIMAFPVANIQRQSGGDNGISAVCEYVKDYNVFEIIIGYPIMLSGKKGNSANLARQYAINLAKILPDVSIRLVDERLTTVSAHANLLQAGKTRKTHKSMVDQVSAVLILENALEFEKKNNKPAGIEIKTVGL